MFKKILISNRGEIAVRIMRACRELGIATVAVYSEADKNAVHTKYADDAYNIGPPPPSQSYLNIEAILETAEDAECEALHPGYGFLAENWRFARDCEERGIKFIGPGSDAIKKMGDKITARGIMKKAKVPVVPGSEGSTSSADEASKIASDVGYPIVLKASAGGGGIGMRIVNKKTDLAHAIEATQAVSKSAFGDSTLFIEKYLKKPRHIEFQILADTQGNTIHVGERECSIQRRHQKLIEETPSPVVTEEIRQRIGDIAVKAASSIGYVNAGTVEFIYSDGQFYFLEMNTRLQVEHPITEFTAGVDLVKEQIRIADGEPLSLTQEDVSPTGHAIECRINAEDPLNDFAPSPGKIKRYRSPGGPGVRLDSGVRMGHVISPYYDPMISKLVVWGRNRDEAINRMKRALSEYLIMGVHTNIPFHKAVLRDEEFIKGDYSTHFIERRKIVDKVPKIVEADKAKEARLAEIFKDDKTVAAISAAVGSYMDQRKKELE